MSDNALLNVLQAITQAINNLSKTISGASVSLSANNTFTGNNAFTLPIKLAVYTTTSLPSAASNQWTIAMVSNPTAGKSPLVCSNGTNWLYQDGTTV